MQVDYYLPPVATARAADKAQRARRLGYDGFFAAETAHDPFLALAAAAAHQDGLDYGTAIAVAFARSPMVTAMLARDLNDMTGGRFLLGLGTQVKTHIVRRFGMDWAAPVARLREYIAALRAVWEAWDGGAKLNFRGDFYQLTLMTPFFDPGPSAHERIPVFIAGVGPGLSRLAGEVADGFHIHPFHTTHYLDEVVLPAIAVGAAEADRDPAAVTIVATVFVVTGLDESEMAAARHQVASQIAFYASTPSYRPVLEAHGWDFGPALTGMSRRGEWDKMADVITDDVLEEIAVVAPLDSLGGRLAERYSDRLDRLGYYSLGGDASLTDEQWVELIAQTRS